MIFTEHYVSPLGGITLASDGDALTGLWFIGQKNHGDISSAVRCKLPIFDMTAEWLDIYFGGRIPNFTPPISLNTTPFRRSVYDILLTIPYGQVITYGEIAAMLSQNMCTTFRPIYSQETHVKALIYAVLRAEIVYRSSRKQYSQAVGGAVGHNPISLIIPCHRVIGTNGRLIGYAAGIERKAALLEMERRVSAK